MSICMSCIIDRRRNCGRAVKFTDSLIILPDRRKPLTALNCRERALNLCKSPAYARESRLDLRAQFFPISSSSIKLPDLPAERFTRTFRVSDGLTTRDREKLSTNMGVCGVQRFYRLFDVHLQKPPRIWRRKPPCNGAA